MRTRNGERRQRVVAVDTHTIETVDADLRILKVVLERNYARKWEFFYAGQKISANITDERFFDKVEAGMPFAKGDWLSRLVARAA